MKLIFRHVCLLSHKLITLLQVSKRRTVFERGGDDVDGGSDGGGGEINF